MFLDTGGSSSRQQVFAISLVVVLSFTSWFRPVNAGDDDDNSEAVDDSKLHSLWSAAESGTYHVLYQLEMKESIELIEEWGSFTDRLFRLDLINLGGQRTSFLTNGRTREMFRYKPFECVRSDDGKMFKELGVIAPLFIGHAWDDTIKNPGNETISAYGLGPLWLRAYKDGIQINSKTSSSSSSANDEETKLPFDNDYNVYDIKFKPDTTEMQLPYWLRFYFVKSGRAEFVDTIDWFLSERKKDKQLRSQVRAKVIQVDYMNAIDASVFKIPVGYGCTRRPALDHALQIDIGQVLLHQGAPSQATFEIVASYPSDDGLTAHHASTWTTQKYSLRAMRLSQPRVDNSSKTESYYVTLIQYREDTPANESLDRLTYLKPVVQFRPKLKRIKRVWWAPDSDQGQATVYTIDQSTGECQMDHQDVRDQVVLRFDHGPFKTLQGKPKLLLSLDQISVLFGDFGEYHLIDEGEQIGDENSNKFRNRFYERRMQAFELRSSDDRIAWRGPVSIVKQVSTYSQYLDPDQGQAFGEDTKQLQLTHDYRIKLIIFFYDPSIENLLFKVVIELLDNHEVSFGYATQQIDVSACFGPESKQDIVVKYPLESVVVSRELESRKETIKLLLGSRLFWSRARVLTPLHVTSIRPSLDPFYLRIEMSILDLPLTHTFVMESGLKLVADPSLGWAEAAQAVIEASASNSETCGQHCEFYNCFKFSFDPASHACRIALIPSLTIAIPWPSCEFYTYFDRRLPAGTQPADMKLPPVIDNLAHFNALERPHLSGEAIIQLLEDLVDVAQADDGKDLSVYNALVLGVNMKPVPPEPLSSRRANSEPEAVAEIRWLIPSGVEHNLDTMNEYSRELNEDGTEQAEVRVRADKQLRLEFKILLSDRTFSMHTGETLEGVTYEQCEQHCELNDCRSFAYCLWNEACQISGQHSEKLLTGNSRVTHSDRQCNIYVLNYLSKFEPYGRVFKPELNQVDYTETAPIQSESDCATACMDHQAFSCQSFYFCRHEPTKQAPGASAMCLLMKKPAEVSDTSGRKAALMLHSTYQNQLGASEFPECQFYSRTYLAQFDKYLGKEINLDEASSRIKVTGSLQDCAKYCLSSKCFAFDACPTAMEASRSLFGGQTCNLVVDSIRREQLRPQKRCSTFVVSDKSHFNAKQLKLIYHNGSISDNNNNSDDAHDNKPMRSNEEALGKPDKEAALDGGDVKNELLNDDHDDDNSKKEPTGEENRDLAGEKLRMLEEMEASYNCAEQPVSGHSFLAQVFSLSLGIGVGAVFVAGWNEAYARGCTSRDLRARFC